MTGLANDFGQLKGLGHTIAMLPNTRQTSPQDRKPPSITFDLRTAPSGANRPFIW
jgi:hypothetical protein